MNNLNNIRNPLKSESATFMNSPRKLNKDFDDQNSGEQQPQKSPFSELMNGYMLSSVSMKAIVEHIKE